MDVFWILLLALLNTNGNKGDPNYGVRNLRNIPPLFRYMVSVRNDRSCHLATGSILAAKLVLTSSQCLGEADHVFYGSTEFKNCDEILQQRNMYTISNVYLEDEPQLKVILLKLDKTLLSGGKLILPEHSISSSTPTEGGVVIGWSLQSMGGNNMKCKLTEISDVILRDPFNGNSEKFSAVGDGSALIAEKKIYGVLWGRNEFVDIFRVKESINEILDNY